MLNVFVLYDKSFLHDFCLAWRIFRWVADFFSKAGYLASVLFSFSMLLITRSNRGFVMK